MVQKIQRKNLPFEIADVNQEGVISGVLNHFGNKDHAGDITLKGAFRHSIKSIEDSGRNLVMLWQHDPNKPIGVWKNLRETERGLEGEGHINLEVSLGREAYALAKQGALSGISIGYWVLDEEYDSKTKTNYLKEVELRETSLVTFPCNEQSRIDEVKKMKLTEKGLPTVEELKSFLLAHGTAEDTANAVISKYMPDFKTAEEEAAEKAAKTAEVKQQMESLLAEAGMSFKELSDAINGVDETRESDDEVKEDEEAEDEVKEDEEAEDEVKSELETFFTK